MTTRVLPVEEWPRLAETTFGPVLGALRPEACEILVVEDGARIVGCWALLTVLHVEGVWVADEERRRGAVQRRLLHGMRALVAQHGSSSVWTGAVTPEVEGIIQRLGGEPIPFPSYLLPFDRQAGRV